MKKMSLSSKLFGFAVLAMAISGCSMPTLTEEDTEEVTAKLRPVKPDEAKATAIAGVRVDPSIDPNVLKNAIAMKEFGQRQDPFALMATERRYEANQLSERLTADAGWSVRFEPREEVPAIIPEEAQPYRRLSGILIGDTVMALIEMEDGKTHCVRPGMRIPDSEWTVVSIDEEKAILRRPGNRRPTTIFVRLESNPNGGSGGGGGNAPTGGPGRGGRGEPGEGPGGGGGRMGEDR